MLFLTNFQQVNDSFMKKRTHTKTNDTDENDLLVLVGKQFSSKTCCFAQVLAFSKAAKIEGEVFVALRASQADLEPSRATISPQSPVDWPLMITILYYFILWLWLLQIIDLT